MIPTISRNAFIVALVFQIASYACAWMNGPALRSHTHSYDLSGLSAPSRSVFHAADSSGGIQRNIHSALFSATVDSVPATPTNKPSSSSNNDDTAVVGTLLLVVPKDSRTRTSNYGTNSPLPHPTWYDAALHLAEKTNAFTNNRLQYAIVILNHDQDDNAVVPTIVASNFDTDNSDPDKTVSTLSRRAEVVIAMGITASLEIQFVQQLFEFRRTVEPRTIRNRLLSWAIDGRDVNAVSEVPALVGPYDPQLKVNPTGMIPWTNVASGRRLYIQLQDLFSRYTSDDFSYGIVSFLHLFSGQNIEWVKHNTAATWEKGLIQNTKEFYEMITQCSDCIVPCIQDDNCRECLSKMSQLDPRDQVTSYRTLVSYESKMLTDISRCIFTKHNIFQCDAQIPTYPSVHPIKTFRNQPLTEEVGRALLVGHLSGEDTVLSENSQRTVSWMVACGANVAYDQFPHQHQLFYPAAKGRDMWYDPFFRVVTLDGRNVWCQRHYKVRPGPQPGTFRLSTSDNGVTSDEKWTIIGAADDLSWLVVHYTGAAKTVGLHYIGGLLCTPDGTLPEDPAQLNNIWQSLRSAGIQPWELTIVDNRNDTPNAIDAGLPPLDYYRGAIQKSRQQQVTIATPPSPTTQHPLPSLP